MCSVPGIQQLNKIELMSQESSNLEEGEPNPTELKHVNQDLGVMRNRVHLLRAQLQKEKDSIKKHKSMTEDMVKRKVEISKIAALRKKDTHGMDEQISQMRERNYSYRQTHKKQMDNILKAVYLVKLDEARQMKSISQHNKSILHERERSLRARQMQRRRDNVVQSENAKQRYMEYWKNKLNSIYSAGQKDKVEIEQEALEQKKLLKSYQHQELELLEQINRMNQEKTDSKKEYLAALTLSSKEVEQAFEKDDLKKSKSKGTMSPRQWEREKEKEKQREWMQKVDKMAGSRVDERYKDGKEREAQIFTRSPHMSIMSSHDLQLPRASVDPAKLKIILKQLKRLDSLQKK